MTGGAPDERQATDGAPEHGPREHPDGDPSASPPDEAGATPAAADAAAVSSPREVLWARLGHRRDDPALIDHLLAAQRHFEAGNNRAAGRELGALLGAEPSSELRELALELLRRIRPDRVALVVLAICLLGLILVWLLAQRAH